MLAAQGGERHRPLVALPTGLGTIGQDAEDPSFQGGTPLEGPKARQHCQPGVLHDLFCARAVRHEDQGQPQESAMVLLHQAAERGFIAIDQPLDERCIVRVRRRAVSVLMRAGGELLH
jgi:hypothetical protein